MNLMAPPIQVETIDARLHLVDDFLSNEDFFYTNYEHLKALPEIDRMMAVLALIPKGLDKEEVTARIASKGISALVCIKSTLSVIPSFATSLASQLNDIDMQNTNLSEKKYFEETPNATDDQSSSGSACSDQSDISETTMFTDGSFSHRDAARKINEENKSSKNNSSHNLLKTILQAMRQPSLTTVLDAVRDIFTESTAYSRNRL